MREGGGKGDKPRPIPNWDHYATNWDKIFKNGKAKQKANDNKEETDEQVLAKIPFGR